MGVTMEFVRKYKIWIILHNNTKTIQIAQDFITFNGTLIVDQEMPMPWVGTIQWEEKSAILEDNKGIKDLIYLANFHVISPA